MTSRDRSDSASSAQGYQLTDRYLADRGTVFLTGIQALARLPLEQLRADRRAGSRTAAFVSGYPGSPLGGYDGAVAAAARLAPDLPVVCRPAMNEEFGATAVMGSQLATIQPDCRYDGVVGIWYGKAPGVDRASDALRHGVYAGTSMKGGVVAIVGDDPSAKSSTLPSSSADVLAGMHIPMLYPGDPAEALAFGRHAIALSRLTGLWAALKIVADVADATASVQLRPELHDPVLPLQAYEHVPDGRLLTPHTLELEREIVDVRYELARAYASDNKLNRVVVDPPGAWLGIAASGITYREVREAFDRLGLRSDEAIRDCGIRLLKMGMPLPFNPETVRRFAQGLECLFVVEEKSPNIESLIKDALYALPDRPIVIGKEDELGRPLLPAHGSLDADALTPVLRKRLEARLGDRLAPAGVDATAALATLEVQRSPFFCSGCPHNRSTEVPDDTLVGAGIGCHTMTMLMDPDRVGEIAAVTCMGNEGTQWIGMADFVDRPHFVQNLGDGTFFHSGQLAIQASVAAGVDITYKLLYNGAVAMTGGQHPQGQIPVAEVARVLIAQGVTRVLVTADDPERYASISLPTGVEVWGRARLLEAQKLLAEIPGTTVLIHDQACAAEARRARKRGLVETPDQRVAINHRICEGCGDCGEKSNCLSVQPIETAFGRKTEIDQTTCNLDFSCLEGDCPSFMTISGIVPARAEAKARPTKPRHPEPPSEIPEPQWLVPDDDYAMRITGIGGTGVVTVAQVLGTAAMLDGFHVRGLDQIGLSQKAGPVVSDLRLSREHPTSTNRLGKGQADLLMAFDQLVAASPKGLLTADPERTTVVGSLARTPTGEMITHPEVRLPTAESLCARIAGVTRPGAQFWAEAAGITEDLFGGATTANIFVVGMAYQAGCLPISAKNIEEAIALNGVAVASNVAAFRWGRVQVVDALRVEEARKREVDAQVSASVASAQSHRSLSQRLLRRIEALLAGVGAVEVPALERALVRFAGELVAFQNERLAAEWLACLEEVKRVEHVSRPGSTQLLRAVAVQLYKLLAYKDEYEVARLMTDEDGLAAARAVAGESGTIAWRLHPPLLRALGLSRKIRVPFAAAPLIRLLARAKFLRGTRFDPFGAAEVRRLERELPGEYRAAISKALRALEAAGDSPQRDPRFEGALAIAELPDGVRGYEDLKVERIGRYRERLREALARLER